MSDKILDPAVKPRDDTAKLSADKILLNTEEIKKIIPHRSPLLLVENVHELEYDKKIVASYLLKKDEPVFAGHFPTQPVYPGVYYIESIAQAGAILIFESRKRKGIIDNALGFLSTVEKARFRKICGPGDKLIFEVHLEKTRGPFFWLQGKVFLESHGQSNSETPVVVAEASLSVALGER